MSFFKSKKRKLAVYNKCGGKCGYCGTALTLSSMTADHILPKRRGSRSNPNHSHYLKPVGGDTLDNMMPSCRSCNSSKHDWTVEEWRKELSLRLARLKRDSSPYRLALRFGMIVENIAPVTFYFEKYQNGSK